MEKINNMEKWFLGIAAAVILSSGAGQIATLVTLAKLETQIDYIKEGTKSRYTAMQAANDIKIQDLRDAQQDARTQANKDRLDLRSDFIENTKKRLNKLERDSK